MTLPPIVRQHRVPAEDRISAIDFVNRVNWFFEAWDVDEMVESFRHDGTVHHFHGIISGHEDMRRFFVEDYHYLVPGVSRHATNHIVDADGPDGVVVRYHMLLIRHATAEQLIKQTSSAAVTYSDDLPQIWLYTPMLDRLRKTDDGWRIFERHLGPSVTNRRLSPPAETSPPASVTAP